MQKESGWKRFVEFNFFQDYVNGDNEVIPFWEGYNENNLQNVLNIVDKFRSEGVPIAILEFKIKKNFERETTIAQVLCQSLCYYCKVIQKEKIDSNKPFYLLLGDDNEIMIFDIHKLPNSWLLNSKWNELAPSSAYKDEELFKIAISMLNLAKPVYYKYDSIKELQFGFYLLFGGRL